MAGYKPTVTPMPVRDQIRMDNQIFERDHGHRRKVTGWTMAGGSWHRGRLLPGHLKLTLEGGGYCYYPQDTPMETALADADAQGYDTAEAREKIAHWVKTGEGARFELTRPDGGRV